MQGICAWTHFEFIKKNSGSRVVYYTNDSKSSYHNKMRKNFVSVPLSGPDSVLPTQCQGLSNDEAKAQIKNMMGGSGFSSQDSSSRGFGRTGSSTQPRGEWRTPRTDSAGPSGRAEESDAWRSSRPSRPAFGSSEEAGAGRDSDSFRRVASETSRPRFDSDEKGDWRSKAPAEPAAASAEGGADSRPSRFGPPSAGGAFGFRSASASERFEPRVGGEPRAMGESRGAGGQAGGIFGKADRADSWRTGVSSNEAGSNETPKEERAVGLGGSTAFGSVRRPNAANLNSIPESQGGAGESRFGFGRSQRATPSWMSGMAKTSLAPTSSASTQGSASAQGTASHQVMDRTDSTESKKTVESWSDDEDAQGQNSQNRKNSGKPARPEFTPDSALLTGLCSKLASLLSEGAKVDSLVKKVSERFSMNEFGSVSTIEALTRVLVNACSAKFNTKSNEQSQYNSVETLVKLYVPLLMLLSSKHEEIYSEFADRTVDEYFEYQLVSIVQNLVALEHSLACTSSESLVELVWLALYESQVVADVWFTVWADHNETAVMKPETLFQTQAFRDFIKSFVPAESANHTGELQASPVRSKDTAPVTWSDDEEEEATLSGPVRTQSVAVNIRPTIRSLRP